MIDLGLLRDSLASEWTKLRSVRSTYWATLIAIALGVGLSAAISAANGSAFHSHNFDPGEVFDPTAISLSGLFFSQLALGVVGIMAVTTEFGSGLIRTTLAATPQRGYVVAAKALILLVGGFIIGTLTAFGAFFVSQAIFSHYDVSVSLSHSGVLRAVIGGGLYIGGLMVFSLGLGALIRHTAGAITALAGIVFVLPAVSQAFPDNWQHDLTRYFPANAGSAITSIIRQSTSLGPWTGFGVFVLWVAAILATSWYLLYRRDV